MLQECDVETAHYMYLGFGSRWSFKTDIIKKNEYLLVTFQILLEIYLVAGVSSGILNRGVI